jgi:hypothetical protein
LPEKPDKKKKPWEVDPTMYQKSRRASFLERRIVPALRQVGKWVLIALAFTYPIYLVYIGIAFGGIAFWAFLAGSFAVIGVIISRMGFASNFRNWDMGWRRMGTVLLGFLAAFCFYAGLVYLKTWLIPVEDTFSRLELIDLGIWIIPVVIVLAGLGLYFSRKAKS